MKKSLLLFGFLLIITQACVHKAGESQNFKTVKLETGDSTFLALKDTAQAHMPTFLDSLKLHGRDMKRYRFAIKSDYVDHEKHEHMWAQIYSYQNGVFKGFFIDSAFELKNIHYGDSVSIAKDAVEDWIINVPFNHKAIGGFSDKYLKSKMSDNK